MQDGKCQVAHKIHTPGMNLEPMKFVEIRRNMLFPSHMVNEPDAGVKRSLKTQILLAGDVCEHRAAVIEEWKNQSQNEPNTERLREKMLTHLKLMHRGEDS